MRNVRPAGIDPGGPYVFENKEVDSAAKVKQNKASVASRGPPYDSMARPNN